MAVKNKLILRHTSGSKSGHVEEFDLAKDSQVTLGRDESSKVRFEDSEDLVSRAHARIASSGDPPQLELTDLDSSNGTFVNKQRVSGSMTLKHGDVVQLGAGGPELTVELDPAPEAAAKATRLATEAAAATRMAAEVPSEVRTGSVGKATVERLLTDTKQKSQKQMLTLAAILLAVVAVVVVVMLLQSRGIRDEVGARTSETQAALDRLRTDAPLEPEVIAATNTPAVVKIEAGWRLVDSDTGEQIYHRHMNGAPAYFLVEGPRGPEVHPWLWEDSEQGTNPPIRSRGSGSGFVATANGFILTNRHVAAGWHYPTGLSLPGRLFDLSVNDIGVVTGSGVQLNDGSQLPGSALAPILNWIPAQARSVDRRMIKGAMQGRLDYLNVVFPRTKERIPAKVIRESDASDAALIKIDVPIEMQTVEMFDNYDDVAAGQQVTVMGYPAVSAEVAVRTQRTEAGVPQGEWKTVPEPTVTVGGIGRVYRAEADTVGDAAGYISMRGDVYQLTINATGAGNSGGPVFDAYGRVVAIFTYGFWDPQGTRVSGAVPIKYGMDLLQIQPAVR